MKPIPPLFGLEGELRSEVFSADGKRDHDALNALERSCIEGVPHLAGEERGVFLGNGGNWYREAAGGYTHQEFSTPECTDPTDAVLYMQAGYFFARRGAERFIQRNGGSACFSRSNVCYSAKTSWGNHECHCTRNPPDALAEALFGHLASRVCYAGSGGFDAMSGGLDFVLSSRAPFIRAVRSGSTEGSNRALFHEDYKSPRGHGGYFRMHLICGDGLCSERALWLRTASTALIVSLADAGFMPPDAARVSEPVSALHTFNADPLLRAAVQCADGTLRTATEIQREYLTHVERHLGELHAPWASAAVAEWRRVIDGLSDLGAVAAARSHDWALKWNLYTDLLAQRGFTWAEVAGDAKRRRGRAADFGRLRAEMLLVDTRFAQLDADGLFETLDATPGLLDHRIAGVHERIAWAVENPPADTRAAARGAVVRRFSGTPDAAKIVVGWSFAANAASATRLAFLNPFNPSPNGLPAFLAPTSGTSLEPPPGARRNLRELLGLG